MRCHDTRRGETTAFSEITVFGAASQTATNGSIDATEGRWVWDPIARHTGSAFRRAQHTSTRTTDETLLFIPRLRCVRRRWSAGGLETRTVRMRLVGTSSSP